MTGYIKGEWRRDASAPTARDHGGVLHTVRTKADLAAHVGEAHVMPDGTVHRIVHPALASRRRWTRHELESTHAAMHEVTK